MNELEASHQKVRQQMEQDRNQSARNTYLRIRRERAENVLKIGDRLAMWVTGLAWLNVVGFAIAAVDGVTSDNSTIPAFLLGAGVVVIITWALLDVAKFIKALGRSSASTLMMTCDRYENEVPLPAVERPLTDV